jgi:hypothetical protein
MQKRGEHTSGPARPDQKMGAESTKLGWKNSTPVKKVLKRIAKKKRRQHERHVLDSQ